MTAGRQLQPKILRLLDEMTTGRLMVRLYLQIDADAVAGTGSGRAWLRHGARRSLVRLGSVSIHDGKVGLYLLLYAKQV